MKLKPEIEQAIFGHLHGALFSIEHKTPYQRGKVRDIFDHNNTLFMVNTDRVSAFDHVLGTIPLKGFLLSEQAEFWFKHSSHICANHLIDRPDPQIMVCKKAKPFMVEIIVRRYLAGSLMREDKMTRGNKYGLKLDPTLKSYEAFEKPIITPTTKAKIHMHDIPIKPSEIVDEGLMRQRHWDEIQDYAMALFKEGECQAKKQGLLLVDTKYEFGLIDDKIHLIDELHTCDSSRFFIADDYHENFKANMTPTMLDKEYLRQELIKRGVDPKLDSLDYIQLDDDVRLEVARRYYTLTQKLTGKEPLIPSLEAKNRVPAKLNQLLC